MLIVFIVCVRVFVVVLRPQRRSYQRLFTASYGLVYTASLQPMSIQSYSLVYNLTASVYRLKLTPFNTFKKRVYPDLLETHFLKQLGQCLPQVVPRLVEAYGDSHAKVNRFLSINRLFIETRGGLWRLTRQGQSPIK